MNKDFHYEATYMAARIAGYRQEEAVTIATAAQFVDDMDAAMIERRGLAAARQTVQSDAEMKPYIMDPGVFDTRTLVKIREIWIPFHFLPGNFEGDSRKEEPGNIISEYKDYSPVQENFNLMCLPKSQLVQRMIEDTKERYSDNLYMIGLRMHVLADTWAHQYHIGTPAIWANNYKGEIQVADRPFSFSNAIASAVFDDVLEKGRFIHTIENPAARETSVFYHGHGRLGHLPDYGFMNYTYTPVWSQDQVVKDNQADCLAAFRQMVYAMKCIKEQTEFDTRAGGDPLEGCLGEIQVVLAERSLDQTQAWRGAAGRLFPGEQLPEYDAGAWSDADCRAFAGCANAHYDLVSEYVREQGVRLDRPWGNAAAGFTAGMPGENQCAVSNGVAGAEVNSTVTINGQEDVSGIIRFNDGGCVHGISIVQDYTSAGGYHYVILVDGQGPKGITKGSGYLKFTDADSDVYHLMITDSDRKEHTLRYNSTHPEITKIEWHN